MIAVFTTFPNNAWDVYAQAMLQSYVKHWPKEISLFVALDDDLLLPDCQKLLRPNDGLCCGWDKGHAEFVQRNKDKDHPTDYRKQAVRFCHKIFGLKYMLASIEDAKKHNAVDIPRYLVWMDADVITTSDVTMDDLKKCLPIEGDAVAYMGRKDWDHSECGWLAFDLEYGGDELIHKMAEAYEKDFVFSYSQWHDSFIFDQVKQFFNSTNLTYDKPGMDIWQHSPMAAFSIHNKGPVAKEKARKTMKQVPLKVETKNSIPDDEIKGNISVNQSLIKNWVRTCKPTDEEIIVVSAGPMLQLDEVLKEYQAGKKIVAVKHAIKPLKEVGIIPWACILLDPRPRVNKFVENPDPNILWFVASQVLPEVTITLLDAGCTILGYHAAVGADEGELTKKQPDAIISGGSATATRGLFVLEKLGFRKFRLYGYDLCHTTKPDMGEKDDLGQTKNFEITIASNSPYYQVQRTFWSTAELIAQYQEMNEIMARKDWDIEAFGQGLVPFMSMAKRIGNLREASEKGKLEPPVSYEVLLGWKRKNLSATLLRLLQKILPRQRKANNF